MYCDVLLAQEFLYAGGGSDGLVGVEADGCVLGMAQGVAPDVVGVAHSELFEHGACGDFLVVVPGVIEKVVKGVRFVFFVGEV